MDTETLEAILAGAEETDSLEFKGAMAWDKAILVKDILAMANVRDGGRIIIGVEDQTFERQGLSEADANSYVIDVMRDQIAPFADPRVVFRCELVLDRTGLRFAVIEVEPFEDVPVICRRSGADVHEGTIYYRSRSRRPQSARVDNSADMRDIVERSAALSARRLKRLGFVPEEEAIDQQFDDELGGL